jgi:hypothetical protein
MYFNFESMHAEPHFAIHIYMVSDLQVTLLDIAARGDGVRSVA